MKTTTLRLICILLPGICLPMTIRTDAALDGMIFHTSEDMYLQNHTTKIMYNMDISIIDKVLTRINKTLMYCKKNIAFEIKTYNEFESNNKKIEEGSTNREFHLIDSLKIENENLNLDLGLADKCTTVSNITRSVQKLINKLHKIKKGDESTILEVVSINRLIHDVKVKTISARKKKLILPLEFNYWFVFNLFSNSKYTFQKIGDTIQFGFEIPLYKKGVLSKVHSRPIIRNNVPYKYRLNTMYISSNNVFYTESTRKTHCFRSENLKKLFCKKPEITDYCDINHHAHMPIQENKCFERLPTNNYAIHIGNDLFFTTINPLTVNVSCVNDSGRTLVVNGTMDMLNVNNCSLIGQKFSLKNINTTEYIIYSIPIGNNRMPTFGIILMVFLGMGVILWTMILIYTFFLATICCHTPELKSNSYTPSSVIKNR